MLTYSYSHRAVAFLDILGFQEFLKNFENEAKVNYEVGLEITTNLKEGKDTQNFIEASYFSSSANAFLEVFDAAISKLDAEKFSCYLFSDNICITAQGSGNKIYVELLLTISELYYEFMQRGYFLRGGIDYGLFIDRSLIALGLPLANAYLMESKEAVFPRILLSKAFVDELNKDETQEQSLLNNLIVKSCERYYLNVFNHIFKIDDKVAFFRTYKQSIEKSLSESSQKEVVFLKYDWLAEQFNAFLEQFTSELAFLDQNYEPSPDFLAEINSLKVNHGH